jgi:hypothetical protein
LQNSSQVISNQCCSSQCVTIGYVEQNLIY